MLAQLNKILFSNDQVSCTTEKTQSKTVLNGQEQQQKPFVRYLFERTEQRIVLTGSETEEEARAAEQEPIQVPEVPKFVSFHEQRVDMKQKLAAGFRLMAYYGHDEGFTGHLSFSDPEYPNLNWVNPLAKYFGHIKASDLILMDNHGKIVRGNSILGKAAFMIQSSIHEARPDVVCAVHSHSRYGRTFSALGRKLLPISQDAAVFFEDHSIYSDFGGVVFTKEEGQRLAKALGPTNKAVILQNHGLLTTGKTVDEAVYWFLLMERVCESQLVAEAVCPNGWKDLKPISSKIARNVNRKSGDPRSGYLKFQPMFQMITKLQPDCLE